MVEVRLNAHSPVAGQRIRDIPWPRECVVASIRRNQKIILPHGETRLSVGDALIVVIEAQYEAELQRLVETGLPASPALQEPI